MNSTGQLHSDRKKAVFLNDLPEAEGKLLADVSELRSYSNGNTVFAVGDELHGLYVVSTGALKITRTALKDRFQVLDMLLPGQCIGEAQVFTGCAAASRAEAHGHTECWFVPAGALRKITRESPVVSEAIFKHLAAKMLHLVPLVESLSLRTVPERVAQMVLDQAKNPADAQPVEFLDTQEELSRYIGCSREAFNRALKHLAEMGFIQNAFPVINILDSDGLQRYSKC
jgi:CRP-like cAMP-binding protein